MDCNQKFTLRVSLFLLQGISHFFLVGFFVLVSGQWILGLVSVSYSPCLRLVDFKFYVCPILHV